MPNKKQSIKASITQKALEALKKHPDGLKYSELVRLLATEMPGVKPKNFTNAIWNLDTRLPNEVYKPSRGLFRHVSFRGAPDITPPQPTQVREEAFYQPFADWLVNEIEECTKAIPLGGNRFRDKWGTPDVIGQREPKRSDIYQTPIEIVSAEIKIDSNQLITAFGQACSYMLFSHKSYLVIPNISSKEDRDRLDSLCLLFGVGLILFDPQSPDDPHFDIRARPRKHEPDMFFVNKYIKVIEKELFS